MRPAAQMWEAAWIALPVLAIILVGFFTGVRLPGNIPDRAGRAAGRHRDRLDRRLHVGARRRDGREGHRDRPARAALRHARPRAAGASRPLLATAIPLGIYNFTEAMTNVESAAAAGDNYNLRSVLLADGTGAIVGAALGSPFPPAVYIGHPGWKEAGGRTSYSMASGVVIALLCFLGHVRRCSARCCPIPAIVPILLYIGLLIGAQAFQAVPRRYAIAVVVAIIPNIASWAQGQMADVLSAAGTSAEKVGEANLVNSWRHLQGDASPRRRRDPGRARARLDRGVHHRPGVHAGRDLLRHRRHLVVRRADPRRPGGLEYGRPGRARLPLLRTCLPRVRLGKHPAPRSRREGVIR